MRKKVIAYFRMSDDEQVNSIERQRQTYKTWLKNNPADYECLGEYIERGKSGDACVTRPIQAELLTKISDKEIKPDLLWVSESSRWGRFDTNYKYKFVLPLKKAGIKLQSNQQEIDFSKPESDLLYDVSQSMSYIENYQRAERVTSGIAVLVEKKELPLHTCYGLIKDGKKLKLDNDKAEIVRKMFARYLERGSINNVVYWLNHEVKIPSPTGKKWSLATVRDLLRNPKVSGHYVYGRRRTGKIFHYDNSLLPKQRHEDEKGTSLPQKQYFIEYAPEIVEPIIDLETWGKTQLLLIEKTQPTQRLKGKKHKYTGVLRCRCGSVMRGRKRGPLVEYTCTHGNAGGCTSIVHYEVNLNNFISETLKQMTDEDAVYNVLYAQNKSTDDNEQELSELREKYARGQQRLYDLEGMLPDGFTDKLRELKKEIDIKERRSKTVLDLTKLRLAAAETARHYKEVFKDATDASELSREQIQEHFKSITVELTRVQSQTGKRKYSSINRLLIHTYMGKENTDGDNGYNVSPLDAISYLEWTVNVPLPLKFARCIPDPF